MIEQILEIIENRIVHHREQRSRIISQGRCLEKERINAKLNELNHLKRTIQKLASSREQ